MCSFRRWWVALASSDASQIPLCGAHVHQSVQELGQPSCCADAKHPTFHNVHGNMVMVVAIRMLTPPPPPPPSPPSLQLPQSQHDHRDRHKRPHHNSHKRTVARNKSSPITGCRSQRPVEPLKSRTRQCVSSTVLYATIFRRCYKL